MIPAASSTTCLYRVEIRYREPGYAARIWNSDLEYEVRYDIEAQSEAQAEAEARLRFRLLAVHSGVFWLREIVAVTSRLSSGSLREY